MENATPVAESIDDILAEVADNVQRSEVDENLKSYNERLQVMINNGFKEDHACKIIAHMMMKSIDNGNTETEGEQE